MNYFNLFSFQVMIPELKTINASVLTVCATDRDSESNGKISYRILSSSDAFSIDPKNGESSMHLVWNMHYGLHSCTFTYLYIHMVTLNYSSHWRKSNTRFQLEHT